MFHSDTGIADLKTVEPKASQQTLIEYIISLKKKGITYSRQNNYISAIRAYVWCLALTTKMMFKKLAHKTVDFMTAHPRRTMAAIAVGASLALSFAVATIDGGGQAQLTFALQKSYNNQQNSQFDFSP